MEIERVTKLIPKNDKIIWTDDDKDPDIVVTITERERNKKDPRTWYALYNFFDEYRIDEERGIAKPIIVTLKKEVILRFVEEFFPDKELKRRKDRPTLLEMGFVDEDYREKYEDFDFCREIGPWEIDGEGKDLGIGSRGSFDDKARKMSFYHWRDDAHITVGHEFGHKKGYDVGHNTQKMGELESEDFAWRVSIPRFVRSGNWSDDQRADAIRIISNNYYCDFNESHESPVDIEFNREKWEYVVPEGKEYMEIVKKHSDDIARELVERIEEEGFISETSDIRAKELESRIWEDWERKHGKEQ